MRVGSLFSGIGGFDLGLERAGMRVLWQCEQDDYCRRVLARHWPRLPIYRDVCELRAADCAPVDVLCGGFPCQDLSYAGKGAGIDGTRSGLWAEYARIIGEVRPKYAVVENVPALLTRGLERVLGDLAEIGYDAEWDCLPASAFGAPHRRDRIWLVAYPQREGEPTSTVDARAGTGLLGFVADTACVDEQWAERAGDCGRRPEQPPRDSSRRGEWGGWLAEPAVGRVAHGVPARVDRLRALGNALVPQIAQWIGERIVAYESSQT